MPSRLHLFHTNRTEMPSQKADIIHFTKMNGAGNDFIIVETSLYHIPDPHAAAIAWCDRSTGIGADGLVLLGQPDSATADFAMRIFNADGSEAQMCGNASRCIGKYVFEKGISDKTHIRLLTASGVKAIELFLDELRKVESASIDMGIPAMENTAMFLADGNDLPEGVFVDIGNPHYVIFTDNVDCVDVATLGPRLEHHPRFPQRCNIEFAEVSEKSIRIRVWERGCGITKACGTGACAVLVAAHKSGRSGKRTTIIMDGGAVEVEWHDATGHLWLKGGAQFDGEGDITLTV